MIVVAPDGIAIDSRAQTVITCWLLGGFTYIGESHKGLRVIWSDSELRVGGDAST